MNGFMMLQCRNAWRRIAGLPEDITPFHGIMPPPSVLRKTEVSSTFHKLRISRNPIVLNAIRYGQAKIDRQYKLFNKLCIDRKIMGAFRYGLMGAKGKPTYDRIPSMIHRLKEYQKTGDLGLLADVANLAELEFVEGTHPKAHIAKGDGDHHVRTIENDV